MSNRRDIQCTYNPHNKLTLLDCSFVVNSTDSGGYGITSLNQSGRIASVFMHTTATPASGSPNPAAGVIVVNLQDNYNTFLGTGFSWQVPNSGTDISISGSSVLTVGNPYTITSLGTTTNAQWVTAGMSANLTAAVGVPLIAAITGGGTGTGKVQAPAAAGGGIFGIRLIGNPNVANSNGAYVLGAGNGMQLILGCYKDSASDAPVLAAPTDGTLIYLSFSLNNSAQGV